MGTEPNTSAAQFNRPIPLEYAGPQTGPASGRLKRWGKTLLGVLGAAALFLAVWFAYRSSIPGQFIWDDDYYVHANPTLRDLNGLKRIWTEIGAVPQYYPLVHSSFWMEWRKFRDRPAGYRRDNILLHALSAVVLWRLLRKLEVPGAYLAAAIWALHPLQVESVAWITERKNVLSGLLYVLSAVAYLRFEEQREAPAIQNPKSKIQNRAKSWLWYAVAFLLFGGALLSKTVTATLPAALLLVLWWKRGRLSWRVIWPTIPLLAIAVPMGLLTAWMERHVVGAVGPDWNLNPLERLAVAGRAVGFYAAKLFVPYHLCFNYERWDPAGVTTAVLGGTVLAAVAALLIVLWRWRERLGRGPLAAVLFFIGTLVPALGFTNVFPMRYSFVADHFQYLAGIGLVALAAAAIRRCGRVAWIIALVLLPLGLARATYRYTATFKDPRTLWEHTATRNPTSWLARNQLGTLAREDGDNAAAQEQFQLALAINPANDVAMINLADFAIKQHRADLAESLLTRATEIRLSYPPGSPGHAMASEPAVTLAKRLADQKRTEEAIAAYQIALAANPADGAARYNFVRLLNNMAISEATSHRYAEAERLLLRAHSISPEEEIVRNLAIVRQQRAASEATTRP